MVVYNIHITNCRMIQSNEKNLFGWPIMKT